MKKGIIMEQHRKYTIVMTRDGLFEKAHPITDVDIGFEVDYEPLVEKQWFKQLKDMFITTRAIALACIFLIAFLPFYLITNSNETYAYVDIDINPSIELEINDDYEVLGITPFNDDATQVLAEIEELKGKKLEEAIDLIINKSEEKGLVNTYKNVVIGVHYVKGIDKNPVDELISTHFASKPTDWEVITVKIPEEVRELAEEKKLSMNEALVNHAQDHTESIVMEEESEVLESFFQNKKISSKTPVEETSERSGISSTEELIEITNEEVHPSELKGKNGEINSNKNSKHEDFLLHNHYKKKEDSGKGKNRENDKKERKDDRGRSDKAHDHREKHKHHNRLPNDRKNDGKHKEEKDHPRIDKSDKKNWKNNERNDGKGPHGNKGKNNNGNNGNSQNKGNNGNGNRGNGNY